MIKKRLFIDLDDTLCNYTGAFMSAKKENPNIEFPQSQWGFFVNLKPIEGAIETVKELMEHYDVWILTRASHKNPLCYTEKRLWVEKYFGEDFCEKLIICSNKNFLKGDYLIDDSFLNGQPDFEGQWLHFGYGKYKNWNEVKNYLLN